MATSPESARTDPPSSARFGGFELDLQSGLLYRNGTQNRLQGQPLQLLQLLLQQPGQIVTREQIQQHLWPDGTVVEFEHSVNAAVKRLREALGDDAERPTFIETIPRKGYRLLPPVESVKPVMRKMFRRYLIVTVIFIVMLGGLIVYVRVRPRPLPSHIHSLAVLPLNNLSGDSTQEYLADGMTEALVGRLARIHDLRVISRTSVMRFKDTKLSVPEIARMLGVDALVEGSVIRQGNRIRFHAQLIRGSTDEHLWSDEYDGELGDILALQSEVAQSIARRVEVAVTGAERARLVAARHISPEAYESYLKGQSLVSGTRAEIEQSIAHFEEAIQKDATFAQADVGLATAYNRLGSIAVGGPPGETHPKMVSAARKAIELDPDLAEPHDLLADAYVKQWQWSDAEAEYKWALELSPNDVGAHVGYAKWLLYQGRTEDALAWSERARELDPLGVGAASGWILFHTRHYDEAVRELRSELAVDPDSPSANWFLGFALIAKDQPEEAIVVLKKALSVTDNSPAVMGVLIRAYAHAGRRDEALRVVDELKRLQQKEYVPAAPFVNAYLGLGDNEQAFAWLEKAYKEQSNILELLKVHPYFDPLRGDPRFVDLIYRVGLDKPR